MKTLFTLFATCLLTLGGWAQTGGFSLKFNRVILITSTDGLVTVPPNTVWKINNITSNSARFYSSYTANWSSDSWSVNQPNPCTNATSGSTNNIPYIASSACSYTGNYIALNGQRTSFSAGSPLWMPAGSTLQVFGTECRNTVTFNFNNQLFYNGDIGRYTCGTVSSTAGSIVPNSWIVSVTEFLIVP